MLYAAPACMSMYALQSNSAKILDAMHSYLVFLWFQIASGHLWEVCRAVFEGWLLTYCTCEIIQKERSNRCSDFEKLSWSKPLWHFKSSGLTGLLTLFFKSNSCLPFNWHCVVGSNTEITYLKKTLKWIMVVPSVDLMTFWMIWSIFDLIITLLIV